MNIQKEYSVTVGDKELIVQFTDLTDQANGSVLMRYGDTVVLATAVMSNDTQEGMGYFPLVVDYEEKFYAAGQILGSRFVRREGKPSDEAVLTARAVDRTIRPLFNQNMRNSVHIVITVLSIGADDPDVLAINAASLALATSDIPWNGPVSAVRVGKKSGETNWTINPEYTFRHGDEEEADILVSGKDGAINMIEVGAQQLPEDAVAHGLETAQGIIETLQEFKKKIIDDIGKTKQEIHIAVLSEEGQTAFEKVVMPELESALFPEDGDTKEHLGALKKTWLAYVTKELAEDTRDTADSYFEHHVDALMHKEVLDQERRPDGRALDEVRKIETTVGGVGPMQHGTGIFYRGGTHVLSALTLGGPEESQILDGMEIQEKKHYLHHYNFPPFSVGETGRIGGFNRRAIGHGMLAERALLPVIPSREEFPYTIRIVSEVLASNGSSSMGSACGSTLALMDAGVPIKAPVAGIAMGLVTDGKTYKVLTDIQGPEDHHGDMDFKVAGTQIGVTAIQMDVKVAGVPLAVLKEALAQARAARLSILEVMKQTIAEPRAELSPHAPRVIQMTIPKDKLGVVIGSGGKTINGIQDKTGAEITLEDDGTVYIIGKEEGAREAQKIVHDLTREPEVGERFSEAEVTKILDFGAFVKIGHNMEGLVHISELAPFRVNKVSDVVSVGEKVPVIIKEVDERGRINLSIKDIDPEFAKRKGVSPANNDHGRGDTKQPGKHNSKRDD